MENRQIKGAALDVFEEEPLPKDSELWNKEHLYLSSHKAGMGDSWKPFIGSLIMRNIEHYKKKRNAGKYHSAVSRIKGGSLQEEPGGHEKNRENRTGKEQEDGL